MTDALKAPRAGAGGASVVLLCLLAGLLLTASWHLTQGTSGVGPADFLDALLGREQSHGATASTMEIITGSRIPRLAAGIAVGFALGVAGALLQSLARNAMAAPDTLAVTGGAYFAVTLVAAFGLSVPLWASGITAFLGGLVAAGIVLALAGGAGTSTTRLILAGSAVALALQAATSTLLILYSEETTSLFAWGSGSLSQLDLLTLDDDTPRLVGVSSERVRLLILLTAAVLTAMAVSAVGVVGFVGLVAPHIARALVGGRSARVVPVAILVGALLLVVADAIGRTAISPAQIPAGLVVALIGAPYFIFLLARSRP